MQLPPTVKDSSAARAGLARSLFERLTDKPGIDLWLLRTQYRMHPSISWWPNRAFYAGELRDDQSTFSDQRIDGFPWPEPFSEVALVHVRGGEEGSGTSWSNGAEAEVVKEIVDGVRRAGRQGRRSP